LDSSRDPRRDIRASPALERIEIGWPRLAIVRIDRPINIGVDNVAPMLIVD
jgi:hypothetical protein